MAGDERATVDGTGGHPGARWLALAGAGGTVVAVASFTVAGWLRPGYSAMHQAISQLGTGKTGWLIDGTGSALGLTLFAFAAGFAILMRPALPNGARRFAVACVVVDGLSVLVASVFTTAPSTVLLHTVGASMGAVISLAAFVTVGVGLRRSPRWRRWGTYSLLVAVVAVGLVLAEYAFLMPRSPLHRLQLGGLLERVDFVWHYGWYVAFGLRLFLGAARTERAHPSWQPGMTSPADR